MFLLTSDGDRSSLDHLPNTCYDSLERHWRHLGRLEVEMVMLFTLWPKSEQLTDISA